MSHLEETIRRIKKWFKEGKKEEPTKVDIFFTERCNLKCKFCNYSKTPLHLNQEMDDKKILQLIDEICEMNVKIFGVLGGEPFLRKKVLLKSMEKIKRHGINGSIVTNGTLLKEKDIEKIVKMEWDLIRFSIDGLKETHDYIRGVNGCFEKVMNSVKTFYEIKKKFNSNFPTVEVNFVLTNRNYYELSKLMQKISRYGISFVYVLPMIELTEESKGLKISKKEVIKVRNFLEEARKIGEQYGIKSNIEEIVQKNLFLYSNQMEKVILKEREKSPPCFLPWYTINITSDGFVTPCAQWPKREGIKLDGISLKEVWFESFEKMREKIRSTLPSWCSRCCVPLVNENREIRKRLENDKGEN